jgi:DNA polymerase-3 subunit gamma/tau
LVTLRFKHFFKYLTIHLIKFFLWRKLLTFAIVLSEGDSIDDMSPSRSDLERSSRNDLCRVVEPSANEKLMIFMTNTPYRVLARKYRPQKLSELLGQDILVQSLKKGLETNKLPHAFVLHGIRGVGKTTTARIIAKSLNCLGEDNLGKVIPIEPCGVCKSCVGIVEDRHLDVLEFDAASRTGVDDIREIIDSIKYKPVMGRYKIFIIDEVHMLSKSAFNALLKTLEEPPMHVKFIFATTEIRKIPDTILSRCMRFDLKRIDVAMLMAHLKHVAGLEGFEIDTDALSYLARAADGSMRDGLSLLDQAIALTSSENAKKIAKEKVRDMLGLSDRSLIFNVIRDLFTSDVNASLSGIRKLFDLGADPVLLMQDVMDVIYFIITMKVAPNLANDPTWPEHDRAEAKVISDSLPHGKLINTWQALVKGYEEIQKTPMQHQAFEMVVVRLCFMADLPTLDQILLQQKTTFEVNTSSAETALEIKKKNLTPINVEQAVQPVKSHEVLPEQNPVYTKQKIFDILESQSPLLASKLRHDVAFEEVRSGYLKISVTDRFDIALIAKISQTLSSATGVQWRIEKSNATTVESRYNEEKKQKQQSDNRLISHPLIQEIITAIPGTTVHIK